MKNYLNLCACLFLSACSPTLDFSPIGGGAVLISSNANTLNPYHLELTPAFTANSDTPIISGSATAGDQVQLFLSPTCSGTSAQTATVGTNGLFSLASPALTTEGPQKYSVLATHSDGTTGCSITFVTYVYDKTGPLISSFPSNQTVAAVPTTLQFGLSDMYSGVALLSTDDSNGEISVSGCSGAGGGPAAQPTVALNSANLPLVTATLAGGNCVDGDTLQVTLNANRLKDTSGNAGLFANSRTVQYLLALTSPLIVLTRQDGLTTPMKSSNSAVVDIAFSHATGGSTTLVTDPTNSAGQISILGNSSGCQADLEMGTGLTGGTITISGCTFATGTINITAPNSLLKNAANVSGSGNAVLSIAVDNVGPTVTSSLMVTNALIATLDGVNTLNVSVFDQNGVAALSADNSGNEFVLSGNCSVLPNVATASSDGLNYTITLSGGTCADGSTITIAMNPSQIFDTAGNADLVDTEASQTVSYHVDAPAQILVDIGGDDGNPTTIGMVDHSANNLVMYFTKNLAGGSAALYCGPNTSSFSSFALPTPTFSGSGEVSWSIAAIITANGGVSPFISGNVCKMDVSELVDSNGMSVGANSGTPITSSFSAN